MIKKSKFGVGFHPTFEKLDVIDDMLNDLIKFLSRKKTDIPKEESEDLKKQIKMIDRLLK